MRAPRKRSGFSLVEVLMSLAITAALMAAVATAMNGSMTSYRENDRLAEATQAARSTMDRMLREIRRSEDVQCTSSSISIVPSDTSGGVTLLAFSFPGDGTLRYTRTVSGTPTQMTLLGGGDGVTVQSFAVSSQQALNAQGLWYTARVTLRLSFAIAGRTTSLTASACPRRNQTY